MPDAELLQMPVKPRLELGSVVRLNDLNAEWQAARDVVCEADGSRLVARVIDLQDANPRAVVDRGELVEPLAGSRNALEELHIELQTVPGLRLLVQLPTLGVVLVLMVGREPSR